MVATTAYMSYLFYSDFHDHNDRDAGDIEEEDEDDQSVPIDYVSNCGIALSMLFMMVSYVAVPGLGIKTTLRLSNRIVGGLYLGVTSVSYV